MTTRKLPSLVRRLTWGVCAISALAFVTQLIVLTAWLRPLSEQFMSHAGDSARQLRAALHAVPTSQRPALAQAMSTETQRLLDHPPASLQAADGAPPFVAPEFTALAASLQADGIGLHLRDFPGNEAAMLFSLPVDGHEWWLERRLWRPQLAVTGTLAMWLALSAAFAAAALLWSVRAIARPLADLAGHLDGQQGPLRPLPEGRFRSRELQTLAHSFNELAHKVTQQSQVRQQLLAGVSHDLRTPLSRLRLRVETQCEDDLAGDLTADLLALEHIVDQFLAYVQGDGHAPQGPPRPLVDCVRQVLAPYQAAGHPVRDRVEPLQRPMDHLAVHRLLANLVDNALDYGSAPVTVVLCSVQGGAQLQVWDQGSGMSDQEFASAQQPFVRLDAARNDLGHCGLGLAIAAQMARHLRGTLTLARDPELGFGIVLQLPPE